MSTPHSTLSQPKKSGHKATRDWLFNPAELAIIGYSGSGKTTLAERLIARLAPGRRLAFVKHGHGFAMDQPGKDSDRARAAGATVIVLSAPDQHALLSQGELDAYAAPRLTLDADWVLVEGYKHQGLPSILLLDGEARLWHELDEAARGQVIAAAGTGPRPAALPPALPWFDRDDVDGLAALAGEHFVRALARRPLYGLVLAGGKSSRMGQDKAALNYHGKPQIEHARDLLAGLCQEVFLSLRPDQAAPAGWSTVSDRFSGFGPLGGILSAQHTHPKAAWLVLACDLPYLTPACLQALLAGRDPWRLATAFVSTHDGLPEPLAAVWEPKSRFALHHFLALGYDCPRKVLINTRPKLLTQADPRWLDNVNHPGEYQAARAALSAIPGNTP